MKLQFDSLKEVFIGFFPKSEKDKINVLPLSLAHPAGKYFFQVRCENNLIKFLPDRIEVFQDYGTKKQTNIITIKVETITSLGCVYRFDSNFDI